jgi:Xaa-Pro aminopeptidase
VSDLHGARRERVRAALAQRDLEAVLVTRLVNVAYLSGFTGSNAALLLTPGAAVLSTDGRYTTQAAQEAPDVERVIDRACAGTLVARAAGTGVRRLAYESHDVTVDLHTELAQAAATVELVPAGRVVEDLRQIKDDEELALLRQACAIGDRSLADLIDGPVLGRTERELARDLEHRMGGYGADAPAFETIVAGGPHSAVPHHQPTDRPVAAGDLLKIDFGARHRGYHADMTRTFVVGRPAAPWQQELYALVAAAQLAGRQALAPGAEARAVDRAARSVVAAAGHAQHFPHGLGHGVGLEIHEDPFIGPTSAGRLPARTPVTVEPGVYLPGRGGVRIEDTLVVRGPGDGGPELLTTTTKELLVLG